MTAIEKTLNKQYIPESYLDSKKMIDFVGSLKHFISSRKLSEDDVFNDIVSKGGYRNNLSLHPNDFEKTRTTLLNFASMAIDYKLTFRTFIVTPEDRATWSDPWPSKLDIYYPYVYFQVGLIDATNSFLRDSLKDFKRTVRVYQDFRVLDEELTKIHNHYIKPVHASKYSQVEVFLATMQEGNDIENGLGLGKCQGPLNSFKIKRQWSVADFNEHKHEMILPIGIKKILVEKTGDVYIKRLYSQRVAFINKGENFSTVEITYDFRPVC